MDKIVESFGKITNMIKADNSVMISKSLNKHGEIKGKNKEDTRLKRCFCDHHKTNKKGKRRPSIVNNGDGTCTCYQCGATFPTKILTKKEIKEFVKPLVGLCDQMIFAASETKLGRGITNILCICKYFFKIIFPKNYCKAAKPVRKQDMMKKKKNKNNNDRGYTTSDLGGWS